MSFPFRQPVNTEDAPDDEEVPEYAKPHTETAELPSYAKPHVESKPSVFSRAVEALKPSKGFKPTNIAEGGVHPLTGMKVDESRKDTNAVGFDQNKWSDIASKFPESWHGIPIRQPAAFLGSLAGTALETLSAPENIAAMGAGAIKPEIGEYPSVRQAKEIPYRMEPPTIKDINLPKKEEPPRESSIASSTTGPKLTEAETVVPPVEKPNPFKKKKPPVVDTDKVAKAQKAAMNPSETIPDRTPSLDPNRFLIEGTVTEQTPKFKRRISDIPDNPNVPPLTAEDISEGERDLKATLERIKANPPVRIKDSLPRNASADDIQAVIDKTKPTGEPPIKQAQYNHNNPELGRRQYDVGEGSTVGEAEAIKRGYKLPESPTAEEAANEVRPAKPAPPKEVPPEADKTPYTIENAPPNQRAKMHRGAHEPVDILFKDTDSREIFGAGQRPFKGGEVKPGVLDRFKQASEKVAKENGISVQMARKHIIDYNAEVRKLGSAVDSNGGNITAPTFKEFFESKFGSEAEDERIFKGQGELAKQQGATAEVQPKASLAQKATTKLQSAREDARARIKSRSGRLLSGIPADDLADYAIIGASHIAEGAVKFADFSVKMIQEAGEAIKPHLQAIWKAAQQKHSEFQSGANTDIPTVARKLLNSLIEAKGATAEQQVINRAEQAKRFAKSAAVKEEGYVGAAKSLSAMKGEFAKTNPGEALGLEPEETNQLFTTIKRSKLNEGEKTSARSALFDLMNGKKTLQKNEIDTLDKVFGEHLAGASGPGAANPYDIKESGSSPSNFKDVLSEEPKSDFLTKAANLATKTSRMTLGFHVPGTAISIHGFNEVVRNTLFDTSFNPFKAAGRFADATHYLFRPQAAQKFLDASPEALSQAAEEGGLKIRNRDIGNSSLFKGSNILTKGINALSNPKPLFDQMIPALQLKSYTKSLAFYEKQGLGHSLAAKAAGHDTNTIFGTLNLKDLEASPTTQKLFRAATLAPNWLVSNAKLGKGMFYDAIKNPSSPQSRAYQVGAANFLASYVALNIMNAINNDGKFSFQNDVGHELDVAYGKDSAGRVRYFSPYGTSMDMVRIPAEIAHAAVEGNYGELFSSTRSRASEPVQLGVDLMTNTDYAGRALYDKTKYGKKIPALTQGANIASDTAGHLLPIGVESGVNLAQGKISPEQFASQVLQAPMKYKFPDQSSRLKP